MRKDIVTAREKKFKAVYKSYVNDVYKICLYYLKDEKEAANITQQVFFNFYKIYEEVHPDYILGFLVRGVKQLLPDSRNPKSIGGEVK